MVEERSAVMDLVKQLEKSSELPHKGKSFKRVCELFNSDKKVVSWKFNEWDYGKNNIKLPCNARGLFISEDSTNPTIVARGYDKFFSVDEVPFTKWDALGCTTKGPYEVSVKANGCIIFFSGLEDGTLITCSKHSTGPRDDSDRNHAEAGELFLKSQLEKLNIDISSFAKELYKRNLTAVAEYCDDSFEEHILEYSGAKAGLYLHGLNLNTVNFKTLPMTDVTEFALKYGFKLIDYVTILDIHSLRLFLEDCAKTGSYKNEEIEGFVIRTKDSNSGNAFFFKYKFEEPYLMYRQWREATKDYIQSHTRVFNFRKHRFITNKYMDFVVPILDNDPVLCENYLKGQHIIDLRNKFLKSYGMTGIEILDHEKIKELELRNSLDFSKVDEFTKFIIIPIAVIGCGKSTTARTLTNIFPGRWAHVENDDITSKDRSQLVKRSLELLSNDNIKCVIIDRNNHQYRERREILNWIEEFKEDYLAYDVNVKIIAVSFVTYDNLDLIRQLTIDRVKRRGDNHQSIKATVYGEKKVLGIMDGFIKRFQEVQEGRSPDNLFDFIIHVHVKDYDSSLENTNVILTKLHQKYPILVPDLPSSNEIREAFQKALTYKPVITKTFGNTPKQKIQINKSELNSINDNKTKISPVFFSAHLLDDAIIFDIFKDFVNVPAFTKSEKLVIEDMLKNRSFQSELHVTLAHVASCKRGGPELQQIWQEYNNRYIPLIKKNLKLLRIKSEELPSQIKTDDILEFSVKKICWDNKILSAIIELGDFKDSNGVILKGLKCANKVPHITLALLEPGTKPFYSNELCQNVQANNIGKNIRVYDISELKMYQAAISIHL
ncbi:hypothetical protein TPHA_0I00970 [Tetrapisispora phaffii CBS 4417]|uniref:tRNA ligase n=1 Tax=Tetrapisispora phaffii (strain ATCC 24235 / CBS 4417 / NBRC 1672 / NRRL Y-8282 / UCD 70-5) TaxID=1071381 RepID=G8BXH5_TETPH|nr:hypothetical protein TPHA_0I00970 [Tetrapisispora phaffii CBS 4417]CCE64603.1 hypothetical protein TPHA_0I00970 [Tetrapisispora phaffii CBS 4417]